MTARIREFLKRRTDEGPCLVVDLDVVRDNYNAFAKALPDSKVYYAIKANPAPEILKLLVEMAIRSRKRATSAPPISSASGCSRSTARPRPRRSPAPPPAPR